MYLSGSTRTLCDLMHHNIRRSIFIYTEMYFNNTGSQPVVREGISGGKAGEGMRKIHCLIKI
jgi:hypothetical protein